MMYRMVKDIMRQLEDNIVEIEELKLRVQELEDKVIEISISERNAWDKIEKMNKKVTDLERQSATRYYQEHRVFADVDDDDDDDDNDYDLVEEA